jgi:hypothetical protein
LLAKFRGHLRSHVVAYVALFFALSGTALAAKPLITGGDVQDGSLTGADVQDNSLTGTDVLESSLSGLTGTQVQDESLTGADVQDDSLRGADVDESSLGAVPVAASQKVETDSGATGPTLVPGRSYFVSVRGTTTNTSSGVIRGQCQVSSGTFGGGFDHFEQPFIVPPSTGGSAAFSGVIEVPSFTLEGNFTVIGCVDEAGNAASQISNFRWWVMPLSP